MYMNGQIICTLNGPYEIKDGNNTCAWNNIPEPSTHYVYTRISDSTIPNSDIYFGLDRENKFLRKKYKVFRKGCSLEEYALRLQNLGIIYPYGRIRALPF